MTGKQLRYTSSQPPASSRGNVAQKLSSPTKGILPEFDLHGKVIIVSGGAQGLGVVQAEALLEAGATGQYPSRARAASYSLV